LTFGKIGGFVLFGIVICGLSAQVAWLTKDMPARWKSLPLRCFSRTGVIFEELIYRGAIFRSTEESLGTSVALELSAVVFGLSHLADNAATLSSALSIAVTGGTALGLAYTLTRILWLPISLHFGWNFS